MRLGPPTDQSTVREDDDQALRLAEVNRRRAEEQLLQVIREYVPAVRRLDSTKPYLNAHTSSMAPSVSPPEGYDHVRKTKEQRVSIERQNFRQRNIISIVLTAVSTDHTYIDTTDQTHKEDIYDKTGDRVSVFIDGDNLLLKDLSSGQARDLYGKPIDTSKKVGGNPIAFQLLSGTNIQSLQEQTVSLRRIIEVLQNPLIHDPLIQGRLEPHSAPLAI